MTSSATSRTHADWLSITCHPDSDTADAVSRFFGNSRGEHRRVRDRASQYVFPNSGTALVEVNARWACVSASGGALAHLRALGLFHEYLSLLAEAPHTVTRLDVAYDTDEDGAVVVRSLRERYSSGKLVHLTRKGVRTRSILDSRFCDGVETGTFYAGTQKSRVSQRTYDKQHERWENAKEATGPWTRYELTVRKDVGATLRDAVDSDPIFWHHMSPAIVAPDCSVPAWESNRAYEWSMDRKSSMTDYERLQRRLQVSAEAGELGSWVSEAERIGVTRNQLLRMIGTAAGAGVSLGGCISASERSEAH